MRTLRKSPSIWLLLLLPFLWVALLALTGERVQSALRNQLFDQYQRWQPRDYQAAPVRIIDIDEASLARLGQWPWPRSRLAELVDHLSQAGVAAIAFDVMFAEPDRTSPASAAALWPLSPALRRQLAELPDHDQRFADSLRRADSVLGFAVDRQSPGDHRRPPTLRTAFVHLGEPQTGALHPFTRGIASLPALEAAAHGNGALTFVPDSDGIVRRVPLVLALDGEPLPTLVSETLRVAVGAPLITLRSAGHLHGFTGAADAGGLSEIRIGDVRIPTNAQGEMWLHYTAPRHDRSLPAWQVIADPALAARLAGHIVLIGSSAQGLMDLRFSPFGLMPGVEAHAQALEQILGEQYLVRPSWARGAELTVVLVASLLAGALALRTRALVAALGTAGLTGLILWGGWHAFAHEQRLLDAALPALATLLTFGLCSLVHHLASEREQRWLKTAFARYVSPNRVDFLLAHPDAMALGGRRQECSFIFTDLAGFTTLMEKIDPVQAVALLNDYLDEMIAIAFRHEGTLDRIVGDAVAIMFSAPVVQPDHARRALACALEMDAFACRYAASLQAQGIAFGLTRIGVHAGEVIVGNFGGKNIFDYRALGDPVNTAARLESVNKHLGTRLCVSEAILRQCPAVDARPVGNLVLKGKSRAIAVFEPVTAGDTDRAPLADYGAAHALLTADTRAASVAFARLARDYPADPLVALHHQRLQHGETGITIVMAEK